MRGEQHHHQRNLPLVSASARQAEHAIIIAETIRMPCRLQIEEDCKVHCVKEWAAYKVGRSALLQSSIHPGG